METWFSWHSDGYFYESYSDENVREMVREVVRSSMADVYNIECYTCATTTVVEQWCTIVES